ncbi:MAG: HTH domain-containing protein [Bacteroidales bacterium]|nr:HTH domain-containing protein [Bacteroidales bacterium]
MENIVEKVLQTMEQAGKPLTSGQIAEMTGLDKKAVEKAMQELKKQNKIISPKRCYWEPLKK